MTFEELLKNEKMEGRIEERVEMILEFLSELGEIPDELKTLIENERERELLRKWTKIAAKAKSIEEFQNNM